MAIDMLALAWLWGPADSTLVTGVVLGVLLLGLGLVVGALLGRRSAGRVKVDPRDRERLVAVLNELFRWTNHVSTDVSEYRTLVENMSAQVAHELAADESQSLLDAAGLLAQMLAANRRLQERLDSAEATLKQQSVEIEAHMTEARTDPLTQLHNRRVFDDTLAKAVAEMRASGNSPALVLLDVDHFKRVNDTRGHLAGDAVLRQLGAQLASLAPANGLIARYGGEEFGALLASAPLDQAAQAAAAWRSQIQEATFDYDGKPIHVTVSCGVAAAIAGEDCDSLVKRCDDALYAAKSAGRNRVFIHTGAGIEPWGAQRLPSREPAAEVREREFHEVCRGLRQRLREVTSNAPAASAGRLSTAT